MRTLRKRLSNYPYWHLMDCEVITDTREYSACMYSVRISITLLLSVMPLSKQESWNLDKSRSLSNGRVARIAHRSVRLSIWKMTWLKYFTSSNVAKSPISKSKRKQGLWRNRPVDTAFDIHNKVGTSIMNSTKPLNTGIDSIYCCKTSIRINLTSVGIAEYRSFQIKSVLLVIARSMADGVVAVKAALRWRYSMYDRRQAYYGKTSHRNRSEPD